jgi:hypothetical protein
MIFLRYDEKLFDLESIILIFFKGLIEGSSSVQQSEAQSIAKEKDSFSFIGLIDQNILIDNLDNHFTHTVVNLPKF